MKKKFSLNELKVTSFITAEGSNKMRGGITDNNRCNTATDCGGGLGSDNNCESIGCTNEPTCLLETCAVNCTFTMGSGCIPL